MKPPYHTVWPLKLPSKIMSQSSALLQGSENLRIENKGLLAIGRSSVLFQICLAPTMFQLVTGVRSTKLLQKIVSASEFVD